MPPEALPAAEGPTEPDPWLGLLRRGAGVLAERLAAIDLDATADTLAAQVELNPASGADLAWAVHRYARAAGRPAPELAETLVEEFPLGDDLERAEAGAGFVNLWARADWLVPATLDRALDPAGRFGLGAPTGRTVCVEHTSANPTGPFHIGRVRNGIIGDTLARVLRAAGDSVTTQYYVDDVGRQAAMITWIWSKPPSDWPSEIRATDPDAAGPELSGPHPDRALGRPYPAVSAYLKTHPEAAAEVASLSERLEGGAAPAAHRSFAEAILRGMTGSLGRIGIRFDAFVWESSFLADRSVEGVVERLRSAPHARTLENGALAIDAAAYGLPKEAPEIVVVRGNGTTLYVTRDIAYHLAKFRSFDRVVDVLGQDHRLHARTLEALLAEVGETRRPEFLIYQDITVPEGGRMSTRKGSAVYLDDLLDEAVARARAEVERRRSDLAGAELDRVARGVAEGAVRFHILRVAPEKAVGFRWEDALSFEGRSGPFVQYAYARSASILRKGGVAGGPYRYRAESLSDPASLELVRAVSRLPRTIAYVARSGHVHAIAGYGHALADAFNRFYERVPVLTEGADRESRIALVAATRAALGRTLELCGVERLETM